jgi:hypothetical protein
MLALAGNKFTSFTLSLGFTNLVNLQLSVNQLTNLVLPPDLSRLETLNVAGNPLTSISLPSGLTHLTGLFFTGDQLTTLTLPPDMTELVSLGFLGNPLTTLVLSESLATTSLAETVATMQNQGVSVFTYPITVRLLRPRTLVGAFQFGISGPPGAYTILDSTNLTVWSELGVTTNNLGSISFTDTTANGSPRKFYRVRAAP